MGVIDVTDLVEKARLTFVKWGVEYLFGLAMAQPGMGWINWPIIRGIVEFALNGLLDLLSKSTIMGAFFLNTAIRKASQANDYLDAVKAVDSLPKDATDEEYEKAERAEIDAFAKFVVVTG